MLTLLTREADEEVVARLEEMVAEAKGGKLTGIVFATLNEDRTVSEGWAGKAIDANVFLMLGVLTFLVHRFERNNVEDRDRPGKTGG